MIINYIVKGVKTYEDSDYQEVTILNVLKNKKDAIKYLNKIRKILDKENIKINNRCKELGSDIFEDDFSFKIKKTVYEISLIEEILTLSKDDIEEYLEIY